MGTQHSEVNLDLFDQPSPDTIPEHSAAGPVDTPFAAAPTSDRTTHIQRYPGLAQQSDSTYTIDTTLSVPDFKLDAFNATIASLNRRAKKLNLPPLQVENLGTKRHKYVVGRGNATQVQLSQTGIIMEDTNATFVYQATMLRITGLPPVLNKWQLRAKISLADYERPLIRSLGAEIPREYRSATSNCEHCHFKRRRNNIFLLQHSETDQWIQVGGSCLDDFLGVSDAERAMNHHLKVVQFVHENYADLDDFFAGSEGAPYRAADLRDYLTIVADLVQNSGYHSRSSVAGTTIMSTADEAWFHLEGRGRGGYSLSDTFANESLRRVADRVIKWGKAIPEDCSTYEYNLKVIASEGTFSYRDAGYAASMLPAFQRALGDSFEHEDSTSLNEYLDVKKGERVRGHQLRTVLVSASEGYYGTTYLTVFKDAEGRTYKWSGSNTIDQRDSFFEADFTVKDFSVYQGTKQTIITRVKSLEEEKHKKAQALINEVTRHLWGAGNEKGPLIPVQEQLQFGINKQGVSIIANSDHSIVMMRDLSDANEPDWYYSMESDDEVKSLLKKLARLNQPAPVPAIPLARLKDGNISQILYFANDVIPALKAGKSVVVNPDQLPSIRDILVESGIADRSLQTSEDLLNALLLRFPNLSAQTDEPRADESLSLSM